jgi:hypothetical protein
MSSIPKRRFPAALVAVAMSLVTCTSLAQEATVTTSPAPALPPPVPPPGPPPAVPPSVPPPAGTPAAAVVVQPAPAPAVVEKKDKDKEERDYTHFRFGLGIDANYIVSPGTLGLQGLGIGVQVRLGAQINQWMAAYYQAHGILGGTLADSGSLMGAGTGIIGAVFNSGIFEATLPLLHIGAGPSVDVVGVRGLATDATQVWFGLEGRAAIVIGGHGPGRHGGFAINLNVHPTFWDSGVLMTFSAGIGGEMY